MGMGMGKGNRSGEREQEQELELELELEVELELELEQEQEQELEPGTWNLEPGTWNLELGTWNLELGSGTGKETGKSWNWNRNREGNGKEFLTIFLDYLFRVLPQSYTYPVSATAMYAYVANRHAKSINSQGLQLAAISTSILATLLSIISKIISKNYGGKIVPT